MTPTAEQVLQALRNTQQRPRNHAPRVYEALKRQSPRAAGFINHRADEYVEVRHAE